MDDLRKRNWTRTGLVALSALLASMILLNFARS